MEKQKIITIRYERHVLPAIASFIIPGLGQALKGSLVRGFRIFFGLLIVLFAISVLWGAVSSLVVENGDVGSIFLATMAGISRTTLLFVSLCK